MQSLKHFTQINFLFNYQKTWSVAKRLKTRRIENRLPTQLSWFEFFLFSLKVAKESKETSELESAKSPQAFK